MVLFYYCSLWIEATNLDFEQLLVIYTGLLKLIEFRVMTLLCIVTDT